MLFLITKKQKDKILDEYYANIIYLFTLGLIGLFVVFLISLFPSYLTMKVDKKIITDKIVPLQAQVDAYKVDSEKNNAQGINNDISILSVSTQRDTIAIYKEIKAIYGQIPNVQVTSINVDALSKEVVVIANIDSKNTASALVDSLNTSRYKGADLPYSVFSQSKNFIFSQTLTYE